MTTRRHAFVVRGVWPQRILVMTLMGVGLAALFTPASPASVRLIYNVSDSAPRGFYAVRHDVIRHGDWLLTRLPADATRLAAERRYLPSNVPLLKRVAALAGDHVCVRAGHVFVNGMTVGRVLNYDRQGRPLAPWTGCRTLFDGEMFVLSTHHDASYDSRYVGPIPRTATVGLAVPIWTWSAR